MEKWEDYIKIKKNIVDNLHKNKWYKLASLILDEDNEYVTEYIEEDKTMMAYDLELKHLAYTKEDLRLKDKKLK